LPLDQLLSVFGVILKKILIIILFTFLTSYLFCATRFVVISDTQGGDNGVNDKVYSKAVKYITELNPKPALVFYCGDIVNDGATGRDEEYDHWLKVSKPIYDAKIPVYVTAGNHDISFSENMGKDKYLKIFNFPKNGPEKYKGLTYSFDLDNIHFTSYYTVNAPEQAEWLKNDLKNTVKAHVFVFKHVPPFPIGHYYHEKPKDDDERLMMSYNGYIKKRNDFWGILDKYNIDILFCGHEHNYSRWLVDKKVNPDWKNKIYQIITVCGGHLRDEKIENPDVFFAVYNYIVVDVNGNEAAVKAYDISNKLIDKFNYIKVR